MERGAMDQQGVPAEGAAPGRRRSRSARWAVPGIAVLAVGGVIAGMSAAGAQAAPVLPARSAAQLLTDMAKSAGPGPMSGTIQETASLGLPALPSSDSPSSAYSALSGTHTFSIWYAGPAHLRISEPVQLGESDLRVNGRQVWLWDSKTQTATHVVASAPLKPGIMPPVFGKSGQACVIRQPSGSFKMCMETSRGGSRQLPGVHTPLIKGSLPGRPVKATKLADGKIRITFANGKTRTATLPRQSRVMQVLKSLHGMHAPTPQQAARQILAALGPTTTVSVQSNVMVAGQAAYQISLAPKDSRSLIGRVQIAIDAAKYFPLRFQVFARGQASPAFGVGFTALSFGRPAESNFSFAPPPGAKVKKVSVPTGPLAGPFSPASILGPFGGWTGSGPLAGGPFLPGGTAPRVMGHGWLSVLVAQPPAGSAGNQAFSTTGSAGTHLVHLSSVTKNVATAVPNDSTPAGRGEFAEAAAGAGGMGPADLGPLLRATSPVHGAWGSGHLLRTSLLNILITSKGAVLAGAVQPSVLYADAAAIK